MEVVLVEDDHTHTFAAECDCLLDLASVACEGPTRVAFGADAVYTKVEPEFSEHGVVKHRAKEYARGDININTNTVESSFAILQRGLKGTFHCVSE